MSKEEGFTLIELLVVIAIIALLMSILMPALSRAKEQTRAVICLHNLHQLGIAWRAYFDDNNSSTRDELVWMRQLWPYYKNKEVLLCPSAKKPLLPLVPVAQEQRGRKLKAWANWELLPPHGTAELFLGSYGLNLWCTHSVAGGRGRGRNWLTANVKPAHLVPLMTDCANAVCCPLPQDIPPTWDGQIYHSNPTNINEIRGACINRHNECVNALFLDSSTRAVGLKELWLLRWHQNWPVPLKMARPTQWDDPAHWMYAMKDY